MVVPSNLGFNIITRAFKHVADEILKKQSLHKLHGRGRIREKQTHVTHRQLKDVSRPGNIDEMLIYPFKVLLISLKMLIQLSDSTNQKDE